MDIQTVLLIASIALFVIGGVLAAVTVRVYFKLGIRDVRDDLSGKARSQEVATKADKKRPRGERKPQKVEVQRRGLRLRKDRDGSTNQQDAGDAEKRGRREGPVEKTRKRPTGERVPSPPIEPVRGDSGSKDAVPVAVVREGEPSDQSWDVAGAQKPPTVKEITFRVVKRIVLTGVDDQVQGLRE